MLFQFFFVPLQRQTINNRVMEIKKLTLEIGHTLDEWQEKYGSNEDNWDFPINELLDGTIEPDEDITYWFINGRLYEAK